MTAHTSQIVNPTVETQSKEAELLEMLRGFGEVIVAFSGGVDSSYLAWAAHTVLGESAHIVTADSPSLARSEKIQCADIAQRFKWNHRFIATNEINDANWSRNDRDRCYFCKTELFEQLDPIAKTTGAIVLYGAIPEDFGDDRPGRRAAVEHRVRAPLQDISLTKDEIRVLSRHHGLPTWDKPQMACLASRVPHGTAITPDMLQQIDRAESAMRELGFVGCRVRHHGELARIEFQSEDDLKRSVDPDTRRIITERLTDCGYRWITVDLRGYRPAGLVSLVAPAARDGNIAS